ncbi:hypothetical protein KKC88_00890 [Patescibacteria group bacterium]|nr:hypothetical protein [Patescibacteria group bacterium]MBU1673315.1 hypothetical protein [Patescibacteria group bacterium]MBU1963566.1 hypothetical protein [Patescibacteria group bacterium]
MREKKFQWVRITKQNKGIVLKTACANTIKFVEAGLKLGYRLEYLKYYRSLRATYKGKIKYIVNVCTPINNQAAYRVANNKFITDSIWEINNVPHANFALISRSDFKKNKINISGLKFPLVVKPASDTTHGELVITNIKNKTELKKYLKKVLTFFSSALVEEFHGGLKEYRILVLKGKILGIGEKMPANVTGNGKDSIKKLIEEKNKGRKRFEIHNLMPICLDEDLKKNLKEQKISLASIPEKGELIILKNVGNLCAGGEVRTIRKIHPQVKEICLKAAKVLDIEICGLDLLAMDISKPLKKGRDIFIEANETPGINLHFDWEKKIMPPIAEKIMKEIFK